MNSARPHPPLPATPERGGKGVYIVWRKSSPLRKIKGYNRG